MSTMPEEATVLVIDNDPAVRQTVGRMLEAEHAAVIEAAGGVEVFLIVERDELVLDAVLAELSMPGVSGAEVAMVLAEVRPELPVVVMSGWLDVPPDLETVTVLRKPFSEAALVQTLGPLIATSRAMRERTRQARADAAESRSLASRQVAIARRQHAVASELMATLLRLRERMG